MSAGSHGVTVGIFGHFDFDFLIQVRPPRPATMCALAQRLRLRSESQREDLAEEQAC